MNRELTSREQSLLADMARTGDPLKEVARRHGIARQTAKNQLSAAYSALDARGAIDAFIKLGWLRVP